MLLEGLLGEDGGAGVAGACRWGVDLGVLWELFADFFAFYLGEVDFDFLEAENVGTKLVDEGLECAFF